MTGPMTGPALRPMTGKMTGIGARLLRHQGGAISVMTALMLPALIGTLGLGFEVSHWLLRNRSLQNAADSAVIAAASAGTGFVAQARAVARHYGLVDGVAGISVAVSDIAACPGGGTNCFSVTITDSVPSYVGGLVGYLGTVTVGGVKSTRISARAIASPAAIVREYCLIALDSTPGVNAIDARGSPKADLKGCGVRSNADMLCTGHDLVANWGDAVGVNDGCGIVRRSGIAPNNVDPYAARATSLPADACGNSYPKIGSLPAGNRWSGSRTLPSATTICGDLQLTGNTTVVAPSDAVLIIRNGRLAMNGFRLQTASGSGLAIVFTGTNDVGHFHMPSGSGALDIAAPTTGTWAGVAMYQDPALTVNVAIPNAASQPTWLFSGLVYVPKVNLSFSGSVGKSTAGANCTAIMANTIATNGTGLVLSTMACGAAGLVTPTNGATGRGVLTG